MTTKLTTDYIVLSDEAFELDDKPGGPPDIKILTFNLPNDFVVGTNLAKPILTFIISFRSRIGSCGWWVNPAFPLLQTTREQSLRWNNSHRADSGLWEAISGTKFKVGEENRIVFAMQPGDSGRVQFRDVVLWFQRR